METNTVFVVALASEGVLAIATEITNVGYIRFQKGNVTVLMLVVYTGIPSTTRQKGYDTVCLKGKKRGRP